jgi:sterol desaturase/sphingolipid hydroxylase (fatty acid hydroxylase superfamily)
MYSPANYWVMLVVDAAGALLFLALGMHLFRGTAVVALLAVIVGFLSWGGIEYAVHRWVLHGPPSVVQRAHARHHREAAELISAPLMLSSCLALGLWAVLSGPLAPGTAALGVFGLYAGYNYYAVLHHVQHHLPALVKTLPGLDGLERAHRVHHTQYRVNYGVTTRWWDRACGSVERPDPE